MKLAILLLATVCAFAQTGSLIRVVPTTSGTPAVGELRWQELFANGQNYVVFKSPDALAANVAFTLPSALPASSGDCLTGTTAGVLAFAACGAGGGLWTASGIDALYDGGGVRVVNSYGKSTLSAAIVSTGATSIFVTSATGIVNGKHIIIDSEIMLVSAVNTGTGELTVSRGANFTTASTHLISAPVGTSGFIQVEQGNGGYPWRLSNGMWYPGAVPYFRPVSAGPGILDVSSNGNHDSWIDICGTDVETGITAFECMEIRTNTTADGHALNYGHIGMKSNGSGVSVRPLAINQSGQFVTIGGSTFSNSLRVQAEAVDAQGITIHGSSSPGLTLTNGTVTGYFGLATAAAKYFPDAVSGDIALRNNGNIGFTADAGTTTHLRIGGGASRFNTHITTGAASAYDIGDSTNYFQTVYAENGDFAPSGVANSYFRARKFEQFDINGSTSAFWDQRVNATSVTSAWTLRDNGGSRAFQFYRQFVSSAANHVSVFGELRPAKRATVDGDAVNDSVYPELGNTTDRWTKLWAGTGDFTGALVAGTATAGSVVATSAFSAGLDNVTPIGSASVRLSKAWTYDLDAAGVVKLGTTSTVGQVWTASDTVGTGGWAASAGSSNWTVSGSDLYRNSKVSIGHTAAPVTVLDIRGTSATVGSTVQITGAGVSALLLGQDANGGVVRAQGGSSQISLRVGGAADVAAATGGTEVLNLSPGVAAVTGNLSFTGTLNTAISTTELGYLDGASANIQTQLNVKGNTTTGNVWATGNNSFSGTLTASTTLLVGGDILPLVTDVPDLGSATFKFGQIFHVGGDNYGSYRTNSGANIAILSGGAMYFDSGSTLNIAASAGAGKVLTSDASGNATWATPASGSNWTVTGSDLYRNSKVGVGAASAPVMALHVVGTQGAPATTGTTPTGTARFVTVNSAMDIGSRSSGNTWLQVTDATNLSMSYGLELNPNGGSVSTGGALTVGTTLEVAGAVKLTSGAGAGKVLISDASGNATWGTAGTSQWTTTGSDIYYTTGYVGMGMSTPLVRLDIRGTSDTVAATIQLTGTGISTLILGQDSNGGVIRGQGGTNKLRFLVGGAGDTSAATGGTEVLKLASGALTATGTLAVSGATTLSSGAAVTGNLSFTGFLNTAISTTELGYLDGASANLQTQLNVKGNLTTSNLWTQANTVQGILTASTTLLVGGDILPLVTDVPDLGSATFKFGQIFHVGGDNYGSYRTNSGANISISSGGAMYFDSGSTLNIAASAGTGKVLTSDFSGNATWATPSSGGSVTSIATSGPISGGTITTSGTISCPTCYTTSGGTLSGSISWGADLTYSFGTSFSKAANIYTGALQVYGTGNVKSGGSLNFESGSDLQVAGTSAISTTATVRNSAGTGTCTLVFTLGLLTGGSC